MVGHWRLLAIFGALVVGGACGDRDAASADREILRRLEALWEPARGIVEAAPEVGVEMEAALRARAEAHARIVAAMRREGWEPEELDDPRALLPRAREPALRVMLGIRTDPAVAEASLEGPMAELMAALGRAWVRSLVVLVAHERLRHASYDDLLGADAAAHAGAAVRILADRTFVEGLPVELRAAEAVAPDALYLAATGQRVPVEGDPPEQFVAYLLWLAERPGAIPSGEVARARAADPHNGLWAVLEASNDLEAPRLGRVGLVRTYLRETWAARERSLSGPMAGFVAAYQTTTPHVTRMRLVVARLVDRIRAGDMRVPETVLVEALERLREGAVLPMEWAALREMEGDVYAALDLRREAAEAWVQAGAVRLAAPEDVLVAALKAAAWAEDPGRELARLRSEEWRDEVVRRAQEAFAKLGDAVVPARDDWPRLAAAHLEDRDALGPLKQMQAALDAGLWY